MQAGPASRFCRPPNVWGTILAVGVLSITVAGLQQLGAPFFVEQVVNGTMLVVADGLAVYPMQRRAGSRAPVVRDSEAS
jgi:ribose/xylose/arabinose/galactoside ABC-type transport system permease subunit